LQHRHSSRCFLLMGRAGTSSNARVPQFLRGYQSLRTKRIWPLELSGLRYEIHTTRKPLSVGGQAFMTIHGITIPLPMLVNFIPVLAALVTTILSIVLARATLRYAHAADRTLELAHEQFEREWAPELHLRLERASFADARMVITNLAKTSVLLQLVQLRNVSGIFPLEKKYLNDPLVGGMAWTGQFGEHLLRLTGNNFSGPVGASASFYASGRLFRTDWFRFTVEVSGGRIERIDPVTLPARRVRVLVPHRARQARKPMVNDVSKELVESIKTHD